jgi:hypothetical protein
MQNLYLERIEQRAWQSYHEDGLMDVAFGTLLLFVFTGSAADRFHWVAIVLLLLVGPALAVSKRFVTAPRMGAVEFGPARKARKRSVVLFIAALVSVTMLVPIVLGGTEWLRSHATFVSVALGCWVFAAFAAIAYWLQLTRMYAVGLLFGGAFTLAELLDTPVPFLVAGTVVALSGVVRLVAFLRRYPRPSGTNGAY